VADSKTHPVRWLVVIVSVAIVARLGFVALFAETLSLETSGYDAYAVHLLHRGGYTRFDDRTGDSDLPPLYPFFLAGVYSLFGRGAIPVALVQTALVGLTIVVLFAIGRRVGGEAVGLLSAAFYGAYPYLLYQNLTVNDTGLFILLLATSVWLSYRVYDTRNPRWAVAFGAVVGLAALTKAVILLLWPLLALWWLRRLGRRHALRLALASGLTTVAVILPWVVRNSLLHGEIVFISTNGGSNLHQGNNPCVVDYLRQGWDAQWVDCLATAPAGLGEPALDRWHREQALAYLWATPEAWPRLFGTKLWALWNPSLMPSRLPPGAAGSDDPVSLYNTPPFQAARNVHLLYFGSMLILGLIGIGMAWRARLPIEPLLAVLVAITLVYVIFHPSTRYRSPADPFLFIFSAVAVVRLWGWMRDRWRPKAAS
jgi:4-amino-4-deoxy-L-arabinose transferase-like glycosyltransferase